jgi:thiamine-monophosphate kinase
MDEFELIDRLIEVLGDEVRGPGILLGPGDDASLVAIPSGTVAVSSIDTLVAGVHFPAAAPAELIGHRALGVSVSDLAAMGADPDYVLLALTLPDGSEPWLTGFAHGVAAAARRLGVKVAGGNLAQGPLNVTVSVHGHMAPGDALLRSGARVGDLVCVSGLLGGATLALSRSDLEHPAGVATLSGCAPGDPLYPLRRYYLPEPQVALGRALRGVATAAIDISDGVVADLGHVCRASGVAGTIDLEAVPIVPGCTPQAAATGGDDYELCFTVAPRDRELLARLPAPIAVIGRIEPGAGVTVRLGGKPVVLKQGGFRHFG